MDIASSATSSAIFAGFADEEFADAYLESLNRIILKTADLLGRVSSWLSRKLPGWNFLRSWWQDDPIAASAAVLAGVVIIVAAGAWIGAAAGGLWGLWGSGLLGKVAVLFGGLTIGGVISVAIAWGVRSFQFLYNFNWQQTDEDLAAQQRGAFNAVYAQLGATLGTFIGSACGFGTVAIAKRIKPIKLNPVLMARLDEISKGPWWGDEPPELADEIMENVKALLTVTRNAVAHASFIEAYKNLRKWVRNFADFTKLEQMYPELGEVIANWGQGGDSWTFSQWVEEKIESIPDSRLRLFGEEFIENLLDSCQESLMIVSQALA